MKKIFLLLILLLLASTGAASAQTATPTRSVQPTTAPSNQLNEKLNERINNLKDKIASRVSELNLVEKRGVIGVVTDTTTNSITLTDASGKTRLMDIDEITKFSTTPTKATFGLSDITKGTRIRVLGLYNKQTKRILARFVNTTVDPTLLTGAIESKNETDLQLVVMQENKKQQKVDTDRSTKISIYTKEDGLVKATLDDIAVGDRIIITGFPDKADPSLLIASRVIVLNNIPKNPKIIIVVPTPIASESATPTLSPTSAIRRVTPTPVRR